MSTHHHRSTLKQVKSLYFHPFFLVNDDSGQKNKPFKSKHATKSSLKEKAKGRTPTNAKRTDPRLPPLPSAAQAKQNRRNHARQAQRAKRQSLVEATRMFNGVDGVPRIVAVLPLSQDITAREVVRRFVACLDGEGGVEDIEEGIPEEGIWRMK